MIKLLLKYILNSLSLLLKTVWWFMRQIKNENFKNYIQYKTQNKSLVILANGPSLADELLKIDKMINTVDFCVMNNMSKSPLFYKFKPKYYVLTDPLYFKGQNMSEKENDVYKNMSKVNWKMNLFVPYYSIKSIDIYNKINNNTNIKIVYYHTNQYKGFSSIKNYLYTKGLSIPSCQNVLIPSIYIAINMGYNNINLYGVDHSWTKEIRVDNLNRVCLTDRHFYDNNNNNLTPWISCSGEQYKMHEILRDLAYMFEGYHEIKKYAYIKNCKIINCTENSFIDAFDRE